VNTSRIPAESGPFAPRKIVGRRPAWVTPFDQLEWLRQFASEVHRGKPAAARQDYFAVLKVARAGVDFAVVGGIAVCLNEHVRYTADADILVNPNVENARRLIGALAQWGEGWARELKPEEFIPQEGSICVSEEFDLDIFTQMRGRSLDDFRPRLRHFDSQGVRIPYLAPEDLIALKEGSWREKDQWDVAELRRILAERKPSQ
jgi:predicted nucleotidyltransferase